MTEKKTTKMLLTYNVVPGVNDACMDTWIEYWRDKADLVEVWRPHNWVDGKKYRMIDTKMKITCGRPFTTPLQIQVDGTVNMCCFDYNGKLTLGDLKSQSLTEIFETPLYKKILMAHTTGEFSISTTITTNNDIICRRCKICKSTTIRPKTCIS